MQLSNIKRTTVATSVLVDKPAIIMFMPSSQEKIWNSIYSTGLLLNNAKGIVVPNKIVKIFKKPFNGKIHFLEMKKRLMEMKKVTKKLPVLASINFDKDEHKLAEKQDSPLHKRKLYYFYDLTLLQNSIEFFQAKFPERKLYTIFLDEIQNTYKNLKENSPNKDIKIIFHIQSQEDFFFKFIMDIRRISTLMKKELSEQKFFDGFAFAAVGKVLIPIFEYNEKNEFTPNMPMIKRIEKYLENEELANDISGTPAISDEHPEDSEEIAAVPNESLASKIVNTLTNPEDLLQPKKMNFIEKGQLMPDKIPPIFKPLTLQATTKDEGEDINIQLDPAALSKVMKYYKISNPDVVANTKAALDNYIKENGRPSKETAEMLVLKAVHKTIHGDDKVKDEYIANPNLLFDKLKNINVFSVPLNFPDTENKFPFNFNDVVGLKSTTGTHRQIYEFETTIHENIEKVFKTLENMPMHPIKVNDIKYDYIDNDNNR